MPNNKHFSSPGFKKKLVEHSDKYEYLVRNSKEGPPAEPKSLDHPSGTPAVRDLNSLTDQEFQELMGGSD